MGVSGGRDVELELDVELDELTVAVWDEDELVTLLDDELEEVEKLDELEDVEKLDELEDVEKLDELLELRLLLEIVVLDDELLLVE